MTPDILTILLNQLLACICDCLNTYGSCQCPCRIFISAGPPPQDRCCEDGQLAIWADRIYTHGNFPSELSTVNTCMAPLAAEVTIRLDRCFPVVKDDGSAPSGDEIGAASEAIYQDLYVMTRCLICNLSQRGRQQQSVFKGSRVLTPNGGCVSAELRLAIMLPDPLP